MVVIKDLADANRHCIDHKCNGCPFDKKKECEIREEMNSEVLSEFYDMIGYIPIEGGDANERTEHSK